MLALTTSQREALERRHAKRRLFIWCEARDPDTGAADPVGFWDDLHAVEYNGRTYHGSGNVVQVGSVSARGDLTIPGITITISGLAPASIGLVRGEAIAQAPIRVDIGIWDVDTNELIPPLLPYFVGFIDDCRVTTPEAGGAGTIELICESTSRALTIERTETRSDASCKALQPADRFYEYTGLAKDTPVYFGRNAPA